MKFISLFSISLIFFSSSSFSSKTDEYRGITSVHFMSNGGVIFSHTGNRTGIIPSCAENQPGRWVIDGSTQGGKGQVSGLLSAYAMGKNIRVIGTSGCGIWGDTETVSYFVIED